jgi:hypothetical protein
MGKLKTQAPSRPPAVSISARPGALSWAIGLAVWGVFALLAWAFVTGS